MANFNVDNASFTDVLRKLEQTDPVHADTFNALFEVLIKNDCSLKETIYH